MLTAFYMLRLWFLAFTGAPRSHVAEHAHESPRVMTYPLVILALFSFGVAWGSPPWDANASALRLVLEEAQPNFVPRVFDKEMTAAHDHHLLAEGLALAASIVGVVIAVLFYPSRRLDAAKLAAQFPRLHAFLVHKWYFDELYNALLVRPTLMLARCLALADKQETEMGKRSMPRSLDGFFNTAGTIATAMGARLRELQTGLIRRYIVVLVLTTVVMFAILSFLKPE